MIPLRHTECAGYFNLCSANPLGKEQLPKQALRFAGAETRFFLRAKQLVTRVRLGLRLATERSFHKEDHPGLGNRVKQIEDESDASARFPIQFRSRPSPGQSVGPRCAGRSPSRPSRSSRRRVGRATLSSSPDRPKAFPRRQLRPPPARRRPSRKFLSPSRFSPAP